MCHHKETVFIKTGVSLWVTLSYQKWSIPIYTNTTSAIHSFSCLWLVKVQSAGSLWWCKPRRTAQVPFRVSGLKTVQVSISSNTNREWNTFRIAAFKRSVMCVFTTKYVYKWLNLVIDFQIQWSLRRFMCNLFMRGLLQNVGLRYIVFDDILNISLWLQ